MEAEAQSAGSAQREYLQFTGNTRDYFRIWIVNLLLTVLTLGIYSAWAKVRRNRYFYGHTVLRQARFDYHARPVAILRGRIVAVVLLLIILGAQALKPSLSPVAGTLVAVALPWLLVRSRLFNMRYTSYSNIRFGFIPAYWEAFRTVFFAGLLIFATFGIGAPAAHYLRNRFVVRHTRYGNLPFRMNTAIWDFFAAYLMAFVASSIIVFPLFKSVALLLAGLERSSGLTLSTWNWLVPAISGLAAYYIGARFLSVATLRPTLNGTVIRSSDDNRTICRLHCDWSLNRLLLMYVVNFVVIVFSLGLLVPWAQLRVTRYLVNSTSVELTGNLSDVVAQQADEVSSMGEEIGSAFDLDIGL